jgi:hypothetical protein
MIIGELAAGVRILLEKGPSRHIFLKISNSRKYPEIHISSEDRNSQKERAR